MFLRNVNTSLNSFQSLKPHSLAPVLEILIEVTQIIYSYFLHYINHNKTITLGPRVE